jgi:hypothetical protein
MKNKRGQFYLIAAIIVIGIVLTSVTAVNYVRTKKEKYPIYNIGDIVNFETAEILNYGLYSGSNLSLLMEDWIINYTAYGSKSLTGDWLFLYGVKDSSGKIELNALIINESTSGTISFDFGSESSVTYPQSDSNIIKIIGLENQINPSTNEITINILGNDYIFKINEGQNFYFVITTGNQTISNQ